MNELKLIAFDPDDLTVLSAHLQDAALRVADMAFLKSEKRFAAVLSRFDWSQATKPGVKEKDRNIRRRSGLRFERVMAARLHGIDLSKKDQVLSLLAISFEEGTAPSGTVTFSFSGDAAIRLDVECLEAELKDLGAAWSARSRPEHRES